MVKVYLYRLDPVEKGWKYHSDLGMMDDEARVTLNLILSDEWYLFDRKGGKS